MVDDQVGLLTRQATLLLSVVQARPTKRDRTNATRARVQTERRVVVALTRTFHWSADHRTIFWTATANGSDGAFLTADRRKHGSRSLILYASLDRYRSPTQNPTSGSNAWFLAATPRKHNQ